MAQRPNPWTEQQARDVESILTCFNGAAEVCAAMDCKEADLNWLCRQAFGLTFKQAKAKFQTVGRSLLRRALFNSAIEGNAKALDVLSREQLGTGPVEMRRKMASAPKQEEVDF